MNNGRALFLLALTFLMASCQDKQQEPEELSFLEESDIDIDLDQEIHLKSLQYLEDEEE